MTDAKTSFKKTLAILYVNCLCCQFQAQSLQNLFDQADGKIALPSLNLCEGIDVTPDNSANRA